MPQNTPHKIITVTTNIITKESSKTERFETPEEVAKRIEEERLETKHEEERRRKHTEPLNCDKCGEYLCQVYECDLSGSRFYHKDCIT